MDHIDSGLLNTCLSNGDKIKGLTHNGEKVHGGRLLLAISGIESTYGKRRMFVRLEPSYAPGGRYYKNSSTVRDRWYSYGCLAASSYGAFQIMFITAQELGFTGHPIELQKDEACAYWATQLITERIIKRQGATTLEQVLDAYNSGNAKDNIVPVTYVRHGVELYNDLDNV
jgi:hypothetical protein